MRYKIFVCDDPEAADSLETQLEQEAKAAGQVVENVIRTNISKVDKLQFGYARMDGTLLRREKNIPNSFKPSGDEILIQAIVKKKD